MNERSQMRLATEEDLQRIYGSEQLLIGFPVRPPANDDAPPEAEQPPADEDQSASS